MLTQVADAERVPLGRDGAVAMFAVRTLQPRFEHVDAARQAGVDLLELAQFGRQLRGVGPRTFHLAGELGVRRGERCGVCAALLLLAAEVCVGGGRLPLVGGEALCGGAGLAPRRAQRRDRAGRARGGGAGLAHPGGGILRAGPQRLGVRARPGGGIAQPVDRRGAVIGFGDEAARIGAQDDAGNELGHAAANTARAARSMIAMSSNSAGVMPIPISVAVGATAA